MVPQISAVPSTSSEVMVKSAPGSRYSYRWRNARGESWGPAVGEDCNILTELCGFFTDSVVTPLVLGVVTVAHVQTGDVQASLDCLGNLLGDSIAGPMVATILRASCT